VETAIPLLAQACGVALLIRSGGASGSNPSIGTVAGFGAAATRAEGDDLNPDDGMDNAGFEPARIGISDMAQGKGGGFAARGDGGWSVGGRFGHNHGEKLGNRRPKINFPTFYGESDPLTWLNKCTMYFRGMRTTADERVWMASLHLEGVAAKWYYTLKRDVSLVTCLASLNL
jgi:hypothetical protein